nr:hypothetical protein [Candidatus Sigynarchaeota archaeon]
MKNKTFEVVYHNRFVKQRGVSIYFLEGGNIFLLPEKIPPSSFLLRLFEDFIESLR